MKKILALILAALCAVTAFAACTGGESNLGGGDEVNVSNDNAELVAFAESLNAEGAVQEEEGIEIKVEARNNSLVFKYILSEKFYGIEGYADALETTLEGMDDAVLQMLETTRKESGIDISSVFYEYYKDSGELIVSREYK